MIINKCPVCNKILEAILEDGDYVSDWYCSKCGIYWNLEDLEFKEAKKIDLDNWLKK